MISHYPGLPAARGRGFGGVMNGINGEVVDASVRREVENETTGYQWSSKPKVGGEMSERKILGVALSLVRNGKENEPVVGGEGR